MLARQCDGDMAGGGRGRGYDKALDDINIVRNGLTRHFLFLYTEGRYLS